MLSGILDILECFFTGIVPILRKRGFGLWGCKSIPFASYTSGIYSSDVTVHVFKAGCKQGYDIQIVTPQRERSEGKHHA